MEVLKVRLSAWARVGTVWVCSGTVGEMSVGIAMHETPKGLLLETKFLEIFFDTKYIWALRY